MVWTRRVLGAAADAVDTLDNVVDMLTAHQLADALQVAVASTQEEYLLDDIVFVGSHVDKFRASALCFVLYVFCLHLVSISIRLSNRG